MLHVYEGRDKSRLKTCWLLTVALSITLFAFGHASGEQVTLRWATWGPQQLDQQLIQAFEREHPNIRIEYIASGSTADHHSRMKVLAAGGVSPDIFAVDGVYLLEFATTGLIQPIDDLIAKDNSFGLEDFFPAALPDIQYRGQTYGLPYISAPLYMTYNVDHMNEAGLPKPDINWDRDTFSDYAKALTRSDGHQVIRHGTAEFLRTGQHSIWPWLWAGGAGTFDENNDHFMMVQPEAIAVLDWMAGLSEAGVTGPPGSFRRESVSIDHMYPGGFPTVTGAEWPFEWDVTIHPAGPAGQYSVWKGNLMGISPFGEHQEEAWTFLKWLLSPGGNGYEIYISNKRFPPSTRDLRLWEIYQGEGPDPRSLYEVSLLLATQHGRALPHLLQWNEIINDAINPALGRVASGEAPAQIAMEEIRSIVEQLLRNEP